MPVGFDTARLAQLPAAADRSWVHGLGASDSESELVLRLFDYQGETPQFGRVLVGPEGAMWVAPSGTTLALGPVELAIPASSMLRWSPSGAELLELFRPGQTLVILDTVVTSPGRAPERGRISLNPGPAGTARVARHRGRRARRRR